MKQAGVWLNIYPSSMTLPESIVIVEFLILSSYQNLIAPSVMPLTVTPRFRPTNLHRPKRICR
jgi:hypothetical protein